MAPLGGASFYIGLYRETHLKRSLSKPLNRVQPHLVGSIFWEWEFMFVKIKGLAPMNLETKRLKCVQIKLSGLYNVIYGPLQGKLVLYRFIYMYIANSLENLLLMNLRKSSSHEPLTRMLFKLAWRFKFVHMKCAGSQKGAKMGFIF